MSEADFYYRQCLNKKIFGHWQFESSNTQILDLHGYSHVIAPFVLRWVLKYEFDKLEIHKQSNSFIVIVGKGKHNEDKLHLKRLQKVRSMKDTIFLELKSMGFQYEILIENSGRLRCTHPTRLSELSQVLSLKPHVDMIV